MRAKSVADAALVLWMAAMWPEGARCAKGVLGSHAIIYPCVPAVEPAGVIAYAAPGWCLFDVRILCAVCLFARLCVCARACARDYTCACACICVLDP